jgi:hypothetical protein
MRPAPTLDRRAFLAGLTVSAGVGLAVLALPDRAYAATATTQTAWRLSTTWPAPHGRPTSSSCKCRACHTNARNKLFANQAAAIAGRAHPGCQCLAVPIVITSSLYSALFSGATMIDRRNPALAAQLASTLATVIETPASPDPFATASTPPVPTGSSGGSSAGPAAAAVAASPTAPGAAQPVGEPPAVLGPDTRNSAPSRAALVSTVVAGQTTTTGPDPYAWLPGPILAALVATGAIVWMRRRSPAEPAGPTVEPGSP